MRSLIRLAAWPAGIALGALSVALAAREPAYSLAGASAWRAAAELAAGYALIGCGLVSSRRRPESHFGALLAAAGFAWFLVEWNNPGAGSAFVFTAGLLASVAAPPLVAHAVLAYAGGRVASPVERAGLAAAYTGAVVWLGLLPALVFDPVAQGCGECPRNLLLAHGSAGAYDWLERAGVRLGLGWTILLVVLAAWKLARSSAAVRLRAAPVLGAGCVYLGLVAAGFAHSLGRGYLSNDVLDRRLWLGQAGALVLLALGVAWSWVRGRRTRAALARLVVELAASPPAGGLEQALARGLGDPGLRLAYPLADGRYVDATGRELEPPAPATPLVSHGAEVAMLAHSPGLLDDPGLVEEVVAAGRLALENERLQAETRAQLDDLRASRARIIAAGDAERRRLERDLHDGAQQRLVSLSLSLRLTRSRLGEHPDPALLERIGEAETELRAAVEGLRELAHGIFPALLADEGLAAAIEALAEEARTPIEITSLPEHRLDAVVETAAYLVVSEAVRRTGGSSLTVGCWRLDGLLVIEVKGDRAPAELTDLEDRVGALDGRLAVVRAPGGRVRIRAEIPCES